MKFIHFERDRRRTPPTPYDRDALYLCQLRPPGRRRITLSVRVSRLTEEARRTYAEQDRRR